jgi:glycosyl transferase family 25
MDGLNVSKIVTISLEENEARRVSVINELAKLNLNTDFYFATRDRGNEERGCFNSHVQVAKNALSDHKCDALLVFEDDIKVLPYNQNAINCINSFLAKKSNDFDLLYLGLIIDKMWYCGIPSIVRAKGAGAHAYILSRRGIEKMASYVWNKKPIDKIMKHDFTCYSVFPIIAEQFPEEAMPSDLNSARNSTEVKTAQFWSRNREKQKGILWKNMGKGILEMLNLSRRHSS